MAGKITTNSVVLGDSVTDTQNFVLKTNADGTATLARGALGGLGTVFGVNGSGALTGATLVAPALGTPASGVLTNCTGVVSAALPAGSVLQVVSSNYSTQVTNATNTYVDTGLTASITPRSTSSKILVIVSQNGMYKTSGNSQNSASVKLVRNTTDISVFAIYTGFTNSATPLTGGSSSTNYLDSPATTSATTYKTQIASSFNTSAVSCQQDGQTSTITLMEIQG